MLDSGWPLCKTSLDTTRHRYSTTSTQTAAVPAPLICEYPPALLVEREWRRSLIVVLTVVQRDIHMNQRYIHYHQLVHHQAPPYNAYRPVESYPRDAQHHPDASHRRTPQRPSRERHPRLRHHPLRHRSYGAGGDGGKGGAERSVAGERSAGYDGLQKSDEGLRLLEEAGRRGEC